MAWINNFSGAILQVIRQELTGFFIMTNISGIQSLTPLDAISEEIPLSNLERLGSVDI